MAAEPVGAAPPALEWTDVSDASGVSAALENQLLGNAPGGFTRVAADVVNGQGRASGSVLADLDGDADLDLFVANNRGPNGPSERHQELNRLYRNDGGELADVSTSSGLQAADEVNRAVGVLDYDGDGRLDVVVTHHFGTSAGRGIVVVSDDRDVVRYSSRETSPPPQLILTPGT